MAPKSWPQVLADRGDTALVFRGDDGLDELTTTTTSHVGVGRRSDGTVTDAVVDPTANGHRARWQPVELRGGDRPVQRRRSSATCSPAAAAGARGAVLLNAAAAIAAHDGLAGHSLDDALGPRSGHRHRRRSIPAPRRICSSCWSAASSTVR